MMFAKKCPKCGGNVQTKSIKKSIGLGFVNIPVAQFCLNPACDWYQDFAEAKKPEDINENVVQLKIPISKDKISEIKKRMPEIVQKNMMVVKGVIVVIVLSILLIFMLQYIQPPPLQPVNLQPEVPDKNMPVVNTTKAVGAVSTSAIPMIPVMQEPKKYSVKMDVSHGFYPGLIIINRSDSILWNNEENQRPRVGLISREGLFKNKLMEYSDKYQYQFNQSGNYTFALAEYNPINRTFNEYPNATGSVIVT
ncbi:MAG: hypothetical protein Q8N79_08620 [Candidatus Methanoperedens sp.]|nr:hypothetical protein [Candidatus Methanoperedens sp.]